MRFWAILPALLIVCGASSGCQLGGGRSKGIFEPADVAPPPSVSGERSVRNTTAPAARSGSPGARSERRLTVPGGLR
jgi:hypothetical protein